MVKEAVHDIDNGRAAGIGYFKSTCSLVVFVAAVVLNTATVTHIGDYNESGIGERQKLDK